MISVDESAAKKAKARSHGAKAWRAQSVSYDKCTRVKRMAGAIQ
jgi:hypothetical protein